MSESRTTFRPDPLWLIDALADDLKQISRLDDAPEEEMLYERGLTLIGRAFPAAARYALEAFQDVLAERETDQTPIDLRRRADSVTAEMLMNLMIVLLHLQSEEDRHQITELMESVGKWPEPFLNRRSGEAAETPTEPQHNAEKQPEEEKQIDIERCESETYSQMKARQQEEVNDFPMAFAFCGRQFAEGMRNLGLDPSDKEQIVSIGGGGFIRKTDEEAYKAMFRRHRLEHETAMDADKTGDGYLLEMFRHELSNHEYGYTRDPEPALLALGIYWEDIGGDERLLHAFETACQQEADWYDKHCEV